MFPQISATTTGFPRHEPKSSQWSETCRTTEGSACHRAAIPSESGSLIHRSRRAALVAVVLSAAKPLSGDQPEQQNHRRVLSGFLARTAFFLVAEPLGKKIPQRGSR
ncbi:hypothetical protein BJ969_004337 [Saccharopolyspora gloriosae]|uniref:Uncharacterized protein n=1 Tax=Saccharopolyspora gloriosae TaxID=455344 RepID=A0A840NPN8_9PSEU|nr:hypothetical protein [Saccharopolyspora gloriosae]MBB5071249.1 hypothetical protein [Saccharopolyspora gloriosae]